MGPAALQSPCWSVTDLRRISLSSIQSKPAALIHTCNRRKVNRKAQIDPSRSSLEHIPVLVRFSNLKKELRRTLCSLLLAASLVSPDPALAQSSPSAVQLLDQCIEYSPAEGMTAVYDIAALGNPCGFRGACTPTLGQLKDAHDKSVNQSRLRDFYRPVHSSIKEPLTVYRDRGQSTSLQSNSFADISQSLGSLGFITNPVHNRPRSSLSGTPFLPRQNRYRKVKRAEISKQGVTQALNPVVTQGLNQGVTQALNPGASGGLNQFAELAVTAAKKAFNVGVLGATAGASLKLFTVCALVVWMQKSGRLPETTPAVLSQVAFRLLIPCFLMSKVATTLYSDFSLSLLAVPLVAVAQILLGAGMGRLAAHWAYYQPPLVPAHFEEHQTTRASTAVAASVALATGQPEVAIALTAPKGVGTAKLGASKEALITATSAFGNSLTLPLVFLSALLGRTDADKAAGYLALYMVGWSPALWTFGYNIITGSSSNEPDGDESDYEGEGRWQAFLTWIGRVMNPPLYGVFLGLLIGATPLAHLFLPPPSAVAESLANATSIGPLTVLSTLTIGIFRPVMEAASLLGTATLAVQTVVLASSLAASMPSRLMSLSTPPNPALVRVTALQDPAVVGLDPHSNQRKNRRSVEGTDQANMLDGRAVWVVSGVRLFLLPLTNLFLTLGLMRAHILPADPVCGLVIMAEAAMPSAQNLVLLAQLKAKTRPLAGMVAGLLLRQYALAILPITFWMAIFLSVLGLVK